MIKKLLLCTFLLSVITVSISAKGLKIEEAPVFAEAPRPRPRPRPIPAAPQPDVPVLAEGDINHARWIRSQKIGIEETPVLAEGDINHAKWFRSQFRSQNIGAEETPVLAEGNINHARWIRSQKIEGTPTLLEEQMGPSGDGDGGAIGSGKGKGKGRGKGKGSAKNEASVLAEALPRRPVKGGGVGGFKTEEAPVLAERYDRDLISALYDSRNIARSGITGLLQAQHNLRRFH